MRCIGHTLSWPKAAVVYRVQSGGWVSDLAVREHGGCEEGCEHLQGGVRSSNLRLT